MQHNSDLQDLLQAHLGFNRARVKFIALFIIALLKLTTVNWTKLANALNGKAEKASNYRRIQRFFASFDLKTEVIARLVLFLLPTETDMIISIDRTNWEFGSVSINILMASVVYRGTAFPIYWMHLDKRGNSNTEERKALMRNVLKIIEATDILAVVGDREFIGKEWFRWLDAQKLLFVMRIRRNAQVLAGGQEKAVAVVFSDLSVGQSRILRKPRLVYGSRVYLSGLRLENAKDGSPCYVIVASNRKGRKALSIYKKRWGIEVLFAALKSRGFDFEATHVTDPERLEKYVGLLAIAFSWAHKVGEWLDEEKPLKVKAHGRKARSIFRYGLDHLQYVLLNLGDQWQEFQELLRFFAKPEGQAQPVRT